jgi:hypothetical protein
MSLISNWKTTAESSLKKSVEECSNSSEITVSNLYGIVRRYKILGNTVWCGANFPHNKKSVVESTFAIAYGSLTWQLMRIIRISAEKTETTLLTWTLSFLRIIHILYGYWSFLSPASRHRCDTALAVGKRGALVWRLARCYRSYVSLEAECMGNEGGSFIPEFRWPYTSVSWEREWFSQYFEFVWRESIKVNIANIIEIISWLCNFFLRKFDLKNYYCLMSEFTPQSKVVRVAGVKSEPRVELVRLPESCLASLNRPISVERKGRRISFSPTVTVREMSANASSDESGRC